MARDNFLYKQIYDDIRNKIEEGNYVEGMKLPSGQELKDKYMVSMITVKKALTMLQNEGLLQRIPGVGTYVIERNPTIKEINNNKGYEKEGVDKKSIKTKKIGIILEHVSSSFGLDLLYKIDRELEKKGYKSIIRFSYFNREKETEEIDFLVNSQIDGLIVMPCHGEYYNPKILELILEGFPVVVIDKKLEGISVPSVRTDNKQAIKVLVKHLWKQGCSKIGFISAKIVGTSSLQERRDGFYEAASEYSIETLPECTLIFDENIYKHSAPEENVDIVSKYLTDNKGEIDGIICAEYSLIPAIMEAFRRTSSKVGEKIKICCVDGLEDLSITHMKQNEIEMAEKIIELLLSQIDGVSHQSDFVVPALLMENKN